MRQAHIPGPLVTRALVLTLCIQITWAGPQPDQKDGETGDSVL